jgi:hypothetical protein
MNAARRKSPASIRWIVRRQDRVVEAEAFTVDDRWRFCLTSRGRVILQRCFVSLSSARQYWRTIRDALRHDGWR